MKLKLYLLSSDKGATLIELLVASAVGLVLVSLTHAVILANHRLYQYDIVRTELNQNLRAALDIISADARETGERLTSDFPALEIINGAAGAPDEIIIRRNILDESLVVCQDLSAGSSNKEVYISSASSTSPACTYPSQQQAWLNWQSYRTENSGIVKAYIYNRSTKEGEFFDYDDEADLAGDLLVERQSGSWQFDYPAEGSDVYMLEEWHFQLDGDLLQVVENTDEDNPLNIVFGVADFQVQATMNDSSVLDEFDSSDAWVNLASIDITVSGEENYKDQVISSSLTSRFFPRNILSN